VTSFAVSNAIAIVHRKIYDSLPEASRASAIPRRVSPVVVRLQPNELDLLDGWMVGQDDIPGTRQDAIRRLIALVCGKMKEK
jgi:hypothetical protein